MSGERPSIRPADSAALLDGLAAARGIPVNSADRPLSAWLAASDGVPLHYLDWGGEGPTVLFLHGGHLSAHSFDLVALALGRSYRRISLDLRGHGESGWSENYSIPRMMSDVIELAADIAPGPVHLVGMSLGGCVAGHAAGQLGPLLASLTFIDVGPRVNFGAASRIREFFADALPACSVEQVVERALALSPRTDPELMQWRYLTLMQRSASGVTWKADTRRPPDYAGILVAMAQLWDIAPEIPASTLIVKGGRSEVLTIEDARAFAARFPSGSWQIVPTAGHNVQEDAPAALADILVTHFRSDGKR